MPEPVVLFESHSLPGHQGDDKHWYLRGVFGKADHVGKNNRTYPKAVLEAAVSEYIRDKVVAGAAYGTLDHEESPNVSLRESAIRIVRLWWEGNDLMGEALVLDTEHGRNLQAILETGGTVGVSARGTGKKEKDGAISQYRISSVDVVSQPANTGSQFVSAVYEDEELAEGEPASRTGNVDGLAGNPPRRRRSKMLRRVLAHINSVYEHRRNSLSHVDVNPRLKEPQNDPAANSDAAKTTHPSRRGPAGMKNEAQMRLARTDRYVDPKNDNKGDSTNRNPFPNKRKPKFMRPTGSKVKLEQVTLDEGVVTGMLKAVATHFGTNALRSTPVGKDIYGAAKAMHTAWRSQNPKSVRNTNLPKSPTQVLSKGTTNMPKRMKESALWKSSEQEFKENLLYKWQHQNRDLQEQDERVQDMIDAGDNSNEQ